MPTLSAPRPAVPRRIALLGSTGTIGRATLGALRAGGAEVTCLGRGEIGEDGRLARAFEEGSFDAVVSCMASRSGAPADAWAVDHGAHLRVLAAAKAAGVRQFVLLSAICVQKPLLAFQHAKLAFEGALMASGLTWSIVRPTAFFKSLSGQIGRVSQGRPFLIVGDGRMTACKPISDRDLADYIAGCLTDPARHNRILPIGGPGPAITPREQGEELFRLTGRAPRFRHVPLRMLYAIIAGLSLAGRVAPSLADKAELARIGRYYASESMLVWDEAAGRYDADATPETGSDTLFAHYADVISGRAALPERGDHAVF
jgi:divinyl chlorophyllide a 8-vinyl-reductase